MLAFAECTTAHRGESWALWDDSGVQEGVWEGQHAAIPHCCIRIGRFRQYGLSAFASTRGWGWDCEGKNWMAAQACRKPWEPDSGSGRKRLIVWSNSSMEWIMLSPKLFVANACIKSYLEFPDMWFFLFRYIFFLICILIWRIEEICKPDCK